MNTLTKVFLGSVAALLIAAIAFAGLAVAADKLMAYAKEELTGPSAPIESGDWLSAAVIFFVFMVLSAITHGFLKLLVPKAPETPSYTPKPTKKNSFSSSSSGSYGDDAPPREYERYSGVGSSYGPSYDDALDDLIKLCHPDKHNGCEEANNITQQLLDIRSKRRKAKKR